MARKSLRGKRVNKLPERDKLAVLRQQMGPERTAGTRVLTERGPGRVVRERRDPSQARGHGVVIRGQSWWLVELDDGGRFWALPQEVIVV